MLNKKIAFSLLALVLLCGTVLLSPQYLSAGVNAPQATGSAVSKNVLPLTPYLVKDIHPDTSSAAPNCGAVLGSDLICSAAIEDGSSLWKTDGSQAGTEKLADVVVLKPNNRYGPMMATFKTYVYFASDDGLWRTNGTAVGTERFDDRPEFNSSGHTGLFTQVGELFYFVAYDETADGYELWITNGELSGTMKISSFVGKLHDLTVYKSKLFFSSEEALWKSDGTPAGTEKVKDIFPEPVNLTVAGDHLYMATESNHELWLSDGTTAGTALFITSVFKGGLVSFKGKLHYWKQTGVDEAATVGLWRTDGTPAGSEKIIDAAAPYHAVASNSFIYFFPKLYQSPATLWRSDGTPAGTISLDVTFPDKDYETFFESSTLINGDNLFFASGDEDHGVEPWFSDGSVAGTGALADVYPGSTSSNPYGFINLANKVYFSALSGADFAALWESDGTTSGTQQAVSLTYQDVKTSDPGGLTAVGSRLYLRANDGVHGGELWSSDGTEVGTRLVKDIVPGEDSSSPLTGYPGGAALDGSLLFTANDRMALWTSGGTDVSTLRLWNLLDSGLSDLGRIWAGETVAYLYADNGLWVSDGQPAGHTLLKEMGGFPIDQVIDGDRLTMAHYNEGARSLWTSTGTAVSTKQIYSGSVIDLCLLNGFVYFGSGSQIWQSNNTAAGTQVMLTSTGAEIKHMAASNNSLYIADDAGSGWRLWLSDGSHTPPTLLKSITADTDDEQVYELYPFKKGVFFAAYDDEHGFEPWISDGTEPGTFMVKDIAPGTDSSYIDWITPVGNLVFFAANDGTHGNELWLSDGTSAGTKMVADIVSPGKGGPDYCSDDGSCPGYLTVAGKHLFFAAEEDDGDVELWALVLPNFPPTADFSATPISGPPPLTVNFKNKSSGDYDSCTWDFGTGSTVQSCDDQIHEYTDVGDYTVSLMVEGPGGKDTISREQYIKAVKISQIRALLPGIWSNK